MTNGDGEIYNLGSDKEHSLSEVAQILKQIAGGSFGYLVKIEKVEQRYEVKNASSNHDKAKGDLGFKDETNIGQTMKEMFEWAKNQPEREIKQMSYEIDKGMYNYWK